METNDRLYYGTKPKYVLEITGDGFDMGRDDFELVLKGVSGSVKIAKKDTFTGEDGKRYFVFDSKRLGVGKVKAVVTAFVPDTDIPGGIRDEVYVIDWFANILNV